MPHSSQSHRDEWVPATTVPIPERPALTFALPPQTYPYLMWTALALAVLSKGLVALIFFTIPAFLYLLLTDDLRKLKLLRPVTGLLLFLAIAAPWHILAALRNPATPTHHGWVWFYFWNEHVLRFLGRRTPADFNKMPAYAYWLQHLAWLFPWTLFLPLGITAVWRRTDHQLSFTKGLRRSGSIWSGVLLGAIAGLPLLITHKFALQTYLLIVFAAIVVRQMIVRRRVGLEASPFHRIDTQQRHILLLALFAATVLLFFSLSTNQEYYTFPAYLPLLLLIAATITRAEQTYSSSPSSQRWITFAHTAFTAIGAIITVALLFGLWQSRNIPSTTDIGTLLAHRNIGNYTLSTSHLFDLTGPAFAALRLPATLAAIAFTFGPAIAWASRMQRRHLAATTAIAFTSALFLLAAHIAFARFAPILSSKTFADDIINLERSNAITSPDQVLLFGDQAFGSSIPFYLGRQVYLVDGRTTSMQFGSTFSDAPSIFLTPEQLLADWGKGPRKLLFVPAERQADVEQLLGPHQIVVERISGKELLTDRPLNLASKIRTP